MPEVRDAIQDQSRSALRRYQDVVVGRRGLGPLLRHELSIMAGSHREGAIGLAIRRVLYPGLFESCGSKPVFGRVLTLRCPDQVRLGNRFAIDAFGVLDGRSNERLGIDIGDEVLLSNNVCIMAKGGTVRLCDKVQIGALATVLAAPGCVVEVGRATAIGAYCFIGGTRYHQDDQEVPIAEQGHDLRGGVKIGSGSLIYARSTILDGVSVGRGAVIGAGAVVTRDVPDFGVAVGVPARVVGMRAGGDA